MHYAHIETNQGYTMQFKTETLSIRIDPVLKKAIERKAKKERMSVANFIAQEMKRATSE